MPQLENIEAIEKRLWNAADTLRANSNYASNEYFMPVMGLIFLRHAYSRFLSVKDSIEAGLPQRGGKTRELNKGDFSQKSSIFLRPNAQFDYLVSLPEDADRAKALIEAMDSIEADYVTLRGILPKGEYQELDNAVLGQLLRHLNPEELKRASGDIFGRIYEYFLTQFADQKAHDGGEFFTPVSLVSLIANVLEPERGKVLDPACGSGGMFVQSAHFVERMNANPAERLTFYGLDEESLAIFDLLNKPDLTAAELKRIKAVAADLLAALKAEKLRIPQWRDKESTRDAVRVAILNFLYDDRTGLPVERYTKNEVNTKVDAIFTHVFRAYPTVPSPYYQSTAG